GLHGGDEAPGVRAGPVDVGQVVVLGELDRAEGSRVPDGPARIRGQCRDPAGQHRRGLRDDELYGGTASERARFASAASRQVSSVTPKASSIISERSHPGVTETAVPPCGASSWPCAYARRSTAVFVRSRKTVPR